MYVAVVSGKTEILDELPIDVYPNPTNGQLDLDNDNSLNLTASLYNSNGQKIVEIKAISNHIDLSKFSPEVYTIKLKSEDGRSSTHRIVIE